MAMQAQPIATGPFAGLGWGQALEAPDPDLDLDLRATLAAAWKRGHYEKLIRRWTERAAAGGV
ncbi:hypothetical protein [Limnochorda pilosa]|uniref:Uncharacterized protein n=1 Tax=Limnochorda pilosa TaxID=1555112 RepID=A0A0K2SKM7_LIMPI|nr:hypothetical protein [Limnochorda pilosa]BAS27414.1 hypothetical protein LIP_1567 [Limnochorda pilosa]